MVAEAVERGELMLRLAPWDSIDDTYAARIPMDEPTENADLLRRLVERGDATPYQLTRGNRRLGLILIRVEEGSEGRELVVVAVYGADKSPITPEISAAIDSLADAQNCITTRFHTCRHGLAKIACDRLGYRITEIVLRKNHGL